jgi:hypothetical protein
MIAKKSGVGTMRAEIGHSRPPFALRNQNNLNATQLEDDVISDPVLLVFDRNPVDGMCTRLPATTAG